MDFMNTFRLALRALARNKMRSALNNARNHYRRGSCDRGREHRQGAQYMVQQGNSGHGKNVVFIAAGSGRPGGASG